MRGSTGGRLALAFACLAMPASASAAAGFTKLAPTSEAFTIPAAAQRSCAVRESAGTRGVYVSRYTAVSDGAITAHLRGGAYDDWDLALFDAASGRRLDASMGFGANEVVQAVVRKGQVLAIQACRIKGSSTRLPLTIGGVSAPLASRSAMAAPQSLVEIPISGPMDLNALRSLGLNLDEAGDGHTATSVLNGPSDAAKLTAAGYTYKTLIPDLAAAERGYRAREVAAAAAGPSALPSGRNTYRDYPAIQADLKKIVAAHPGLARPITLPKKTFQGRDIQGIEVSSNVKAEDDGKPSFFLMGEHHAREWPSAEIPVEFGLYLTNNYGKNARVAALLKKVRIFIV